jgi:hypothetical protein
MNRKKAASIVAICMVLVTVLSAVMVYAPSPEDKFPSRIDVAIVCEPVQFADSLTVLDGCLAEGYTYFYEVPAGKMLVIEYVSVRADDIAADDSLSVEVITTVNGTLVTHYLGLVEPQGRVKIDECSTNYQFISKEVKLYADPDTFVSVGADRLTRHPEVFVVIAMSGYLMDVP